MLRFSVKVGHHVICFPLHLSNQPTDLSILCLCCEIALRQTLDGFSQNHRWSLEELQTKRKQQFVDNVAEKCYRVASVSLPFPFFLTGAFSSPHWHLYDFSRSPSANKYKSKPFRFKKTVASTWLLLFTSPNYRPHKSSSITCCQTIFLLRHFCIR